MSFEGAKYYMKGVLRFFIFMKRVVNIWAAIVLMVSVSCSGSNQNSEINTSAIAKQDIICKLSNTMIITIGDTQLKATLADNSSAEALKKVLAKRTISIKMRDYANMEKVGFLKRFLPKNDEPITTKPGDLILYHGCMLVIYYAPNSYNFTRLGKIDNITSERLMELLGKGKVKVTLSLEE
nr:cyclophilin-like fold protein [uncultured Carboxylicivirga sp.]